MGNENIVIGNIEQLTNSKASDFSPAPFLTIKHQHIANAAKMAAKVMAGKDWHTLSIREHDLVRYLFRAGLIEKENNNGFVGKAI